MRVTSNAFTNDLVDQLGSLVARQARLQNQAATGQRVTNPEDDPKTVRRVLDLQHEAGTVAQYQRNIERQQELATSTFSAVSALKKVSDRAGEIATLADELKSPEQLKAYATEVTELIQQAVQLGNTKNRGNYLFAGTQTNTPPFVVTTGTDGRVTGVSYQGNAAVPESEIAEGVLWSSQVPGANSGTTGERGLLSDSRSGADLLGHLISLQDHLLAGDTTAIAQTDREQLALDEDNLIYHVGNNGAVQSRLEASAAIAKNRALSLDQEVSAEADVDLAETILRLSQSQTAYQAALQTASNVLQLSLVDYLR